MAIATMDSAKDTESMPTMYPVKIIEVMGRDAGWVAASAEPRKVTDEDAPHLVYVPERPLSRRHSCDDIERRAPRARTRGRSGDRDAARRARTPFRRSRIERRGRRTSDIRCCVARRVPCAGWCRENSACVPLRQAGKSAAHVVPLHIAVDLAEAEEVGREQPCGEPWPGETDLMITLMRDVRPAVSVRTPARPRSRRWPIGSGCCPTNFLRRIPRLPPRHFAGTRCPCSARMRCPSMPVGSATRRDLTDSPYRLYRSKNWMTIRPLQRFWSDERRWTAYGLCDLDVPYRRSRAVPGGRCTRGTWLQ